VARTAHFNSVQKVVFANGPTAAAFFLAEKHRHMPSAARAEDCPPAERPNAAAKATPAGGAAAAGGRAKGQNANGQKRAVGADAGRNPKRELIDELSKVGGHSPTRA
jgi:hypothetical protein